jgi:hypothetical protein
MTIRSMNSAARAARKYLFSATCRSNERAALVVLIGIALALRGPSILLAEDTGTPAALTLPDAPQANNSQPPQDEADKKKQERNVAAGELHVEEHQHLMGFIPYFNTVFGDTAPPLRPSQKFDLAFRRSITPLTFIGAGLIAGIGQANNSFPKYGQGAQGYGKRFGSQYADTFDSNMLGSAIFPVILHQDPRYYRMGTGGFRKRFWYSLSTAVRTKGDDGKWQPGFSPILGSFAAGGISNLYFPPPNRGAGLTFERGSLQIAERALSLMFDEFLPDIQHRLFGSKIPASTNVQPWRQTP